MEYHNTSMFGTAPPLGSVFGNGHAAKLVAPILACEERSLGVTAAPRKIIYLGREAETTIRTLRIFFEIGREYLAGATSQRDVATNLEKRLLAAPHAEGFPCAASSVRRTCQNAAIFFAPYFGISNGRAPLFQTGKGKAIIGLSEQGKVAWSMTREFLIGYGIITECD